MASSAEWMAAFCWSGLGSPSSAELNDCALIVTVIE
jgi:hypothetical protein